MVTITNSIITTNNLTRRFGSTVAVENLSFQINEGEIFGLLGPNGAGKTTTIRILSCLIPPSAGSATVAGYDITRHQAKVRGLVGILTENQALYERLTPYENLEFFAEAYGLTDPQDRKRRITELLDFFDLWERRNYKTGTLSRGMKQKLALARALIHSPPILYLDEPTTGLDPEASRAIRHLLSLLSHNEKRTILFCTHHLEDAEKLCNRVLVMNRGRALMSGSTQELNAKLGEKSVLFITLSNLNQNILENIREIPEIQELRVEELTRMEIILENIEETTPQVVKKIVESGGKILSVNIAHSTLEDTYIKLVQSRWK